MADHTSDDAAIARLLAADNPEQFYEYDYGAEEGQSDDDPDYGAKRRRGRPGKKKAAAAADLPAVVPVTFDAAAAFGPAAAAAAAPAAAAAAADPGAAAAAPPAMVVPGAAGAAPTVLSTEQLQLMLQQQALIAAMAAQAGGPIQGLQLAPPPGVSLEQAQLMGLPIMAMPVVAGAMPAAAALPPPAAAKPVARGGGGTSGDDEYTASGRRKRKDTGKTRQQSRSWTDDEERLFVEALHLYGRDWKRCAEHVGTRDHRAFTSHAQKHFIKLLLAGEEVPPEVAESGRGYTLSGKPLDPNSASARAYGLKPDLFARIAGTGTLVVGVHVTTLDMTEGPPTQIARTKSGKSLGGGGGAAGSKRQKRGGKSGPVASYGGSGGETEEEEDDEAFMASVVQGEMAPRAAEPSEYVRNRPRRQVGRRTHLGGTSESTDLTQLHSFVGPPGTGAPLAQPFQATIDTQALLVMDFHAHLSRCEIIGLLGGCFDAERRVLEIREAYPCRRAEGEASGTSVELDAESQVEASTLMEARGQVPVGWYHSHPVFEARPSQKDNENQRNYQALCRDAGSGLEPWVGAIVGPYDQTLESASSQVQLWVVKVHGGDLKPYNVRAATTGAGALPSQQTEQALAMAVEQLEGDPGRVDLGALWRPFSRLRAQTPEGPPLTKIQKLRDSLAAHLPLAAHPAESAAFLGRVQALVESRWRVSLPPSQPPAGASADATAAAAAPVGLQPPVGAEQLPVLPLMGLEAGLAPVAAAVAEAKQEGVEQQQQQQPPEAEPRPPDMPMLPQV